MIAEIKYVIPSDKIAELIKEVLSDPLKLSLSLGNKLIVEYVVTKDTDGDIFLHEIEKE
jgi:hypothetical protein